MGARGGRAPRRVAGRRTGSRATASTPTYARSALISDPRRPGARRLVLDGVDCSYVDLIDPTHLEFPYVRRIADVAQLVWPEPAPIDVVHLGGGGFTLPNYLATTRPGVRQLVYECDPRLVELAQESLGLRITPDLQVRVGDAREGLRGRGAGTADLVVCDAFVGPLVPPHLTTAQFVRTVRRVLRGDGVYVLNVIDSRALTLARAVASTLLAGFGDVSVVADPGVLAGRRRGNLVFVAADRPLPVSGLERRARSTPPIERVLAAEALTAFADGAPVLHDP